MALAAGIAPAEAAALDARSFRALEQAVGDRWTARDELAALTVELLHALLCVQLARGGVKRVIPPLRVPRPADKRRARPASGQSLTAALGLVRGER
jgi:hypothetical protein